ncbi:MAG: hypothetical protein LUD02_02640 [Tannerellaceae bacterium]|nr:hypothetical protein [Tannerellaceae bacterium]
MQKYSIEIFPPLYQQVRENYIVDGFVCPVCNGQGKFREQTGFEEFYNECCDYCQGAGRLKAEIQIEWKGDKK